MAKKATDQRRLTDDALEQLRLVSRTRQGANSARIIRAARTFARRWAAWATTPEQMPDEDTVEAASELLELLGVEIHG